MKKPALFLVLLLFILSSASAASLDVNVFSYAKGETMVIAGRSVEESVSLEALMDGRIIFRELIPVDGAGVFTFERGISFLDPSGEWQFRVTDSRGTAEAKIEVSPTRESNFLAISFLSPLPVSYLRSSSLTATVRITDAGALVDDAVAVVWDPSGRKLLMERVAEGIYAVDIEVLPDARTGGFDLIVLASRKQASGELVGGERSLRIGIEQTPIRINLLEPYDRRFVFGDDLLVTLSLSYADGGVPAHASGAFQMGGHTTPFSCDQGACTALLAKDRLATLSNQAYDTNISIQDGYGNTGFSAVSFGPSGYWEWYLSQNYIFYLFPLLFIIYVIFLSGREAINFIAKVATETRLNKYLMLKKKLQEDFYERGVISRAKYFELKSLYDAEMTPLKKRLKDLKEKEKYF